jgi:hypothetical protein
VNTAPVRKADKPLLLAALLCLLGLLISACGAQPQPAAPSPAQRGSLERWSHYRARGSLPHRRRSTRSSRTSEGQESRQQGHVQLWIKRDTGNPDRAGAPADVFAAASPATMKIATAAGAANTPKDFLFPNAQSRRAQGQSAQDHGLAGLWR